MSTYTVEFLEVLGLPPGAEEADVELARMRLCEMLGASPTLPDAVLTKLAKQMRIQLPKQQATQAAAPPVPGHTAPQAGYYAPPAQATYAAPPGQAAYAVPQAPAASAASQAEPAQPMPSKRGAADPNELANIPRQTQTGLRTLGSLRSTQTGMKPVHSLIGNTGEHPVGEQAGIQSPNEDRPQAASQSLRTSARFASLESMPAPPDANPVKALLNKLMSLFRRER